jgi:hypothetical protein
MYKKNRDLDENGNPIRSRYIHDHDEEFFWFMLLTTVGILLSITVVVIISCVICRSCIRKPAVSENSFLVRSFVEAEVTRRSMIASEVESQGRRGKGGRFNRYDNYEPKDIELQLV